MLGRSDKFPLQPFPCPLYRGLLWLLFWGFVVSESGVVVFGGDKEGVGCFDDSGSEEYVSGGGGP